MQFTEEQIRKAFNSNVDSVYPLTVVTDDVVFFLDEKGNTKCSISVEKFEQLKKFKRQ